MNNYNKIINILESYRYSKTYYDIEKDIAKIYLYEIKEKANQFYNKNENLLIESGLDDYYISDNININESAGYVVKSIINTIIKGLKIIGRAFIIAFKKSTTIETDRDQTHTSTTYVQVPNSNGGTDSHTSTIIWKDAIPLNNLLKSYSGSSYDPEIVNKIKTTIDNNSNKYNISCKLSNKSIPLNKYYSNNLTSVKYFLPIISYNTFVVDPIGNKYCSINIVDLADFISRASSAKDEHDFQQLLESINNSCDKAKEKGVKILANDNSVRKSCNKVEAITNKIEKTSDKIENKSVKDDKSINIANTLKLAHEIITALNEVTANTSKLYENVMNFRNSCINELSEYFTNKRNEKNKLGVND